MKRRTLVLGTVVASLIVATTVAFIFFDRGAKGQQKPIKKYSELPRIISDVETLEIVDEANLKQKGTTDAFVEFKVRNNSNKPVIAINIESGDDINASGEMTSGIIGDEPPRIIIQPYETYKMRFPISNVISESPIRIGGVIYADGTEDGKESVLKSMRKSIENSKENYKKYKEDSSQ